MEEIHVRQRHLRGLVHLVEEHLVYMEDNLHSTGPVSPSIANVHNNSHRNTTIEHPMTTPTTPSIANNPHDQSTIHASSSHDRDFIFTSSLLWLLKKQMAQDSANTTQNGMFRLLSTLSLSLSLSLTSLYHPPNYYYYFV
ncbi:unnamed protein product [Trichobilharzia regenti]|nr:unnamed protein product [Trichobilharzia regenti]